MKLEQCISIIFIVFVVLIAIIAITSFNNNDNNDTCIENSSKSDQSEYFDRDKKSKNINKNMGKNKGCTLCPKKYSYYVENGYAVHMISK